MRKSAPSFGVKDIRLKRYMKTKKTLTTQRESVLNRIKQAWSRRDLKAVHQLVKKLKQQKTSKFVTGIQGEA